MKQIKMMLCSVAAGILLSLSGLSYSASQVDAGHADHEGHSNTEQQAGGNYVEGVHYERLKAPIRIRSKNKVEVAEYFSYGCPHCYQFEPHVAAWKSKLPTDVAFTRTPAIWNKDYQVYARTYFVAKSLKILDKVHGPLFMAIQQQRRPLNTPELMARWFEQQGVAVKDFAKAYASFGVNSSVQQADSKGRAYRSGGVPAIIVHGKYRIEGSMAGNFTEMLKIASYLIEKERKLLNSAAAS